MENKNILRLLYHDYDYSMIMNIIIIIMIRICLSVYHDDHCHCLSGDGYSISKSQTNIPTAMITTEDRHWQDNSIHINYPFRYSLFDYYV